MASLVNIEVVLGEEAPEIEWEKTFGEYLAEGISVQQTEDEGYIVTGTNTVPTPPMGIGVSKLYLLKTNKDGNKEWEKTFGEYPTGGRSVQQTEDGGYVAIGTIRTGGDDDAYLLKTDKDGNKEWEKTFGHFYDTTPHADFGFSVQQTADGGYVACGQGFLNFGDLAFWYTFLFKTDKDGNKEWEKTFRDRFCNLLQQTADGGYIIYGTAHDEKNYIVGLLLKTDKDGNKEWEKMIGVDSDTILEDVQPTEDGGIILTGRVDYYGKHKLYLLKTDKDGNKEWEKTFDEEFYVLTTSVQQTSDKGYIISASSSRGDFPTKLIKTNSYGSVEWEKMFNDPKMGDYDTINDVKETLDYGYIITGRSNNIYKSGLYLAKLKGYIFIAEFYVEKSADTESNKKRIEINEPIEIGTGEEKQRFIYLNPGDKLGCKLTADSNLGAVTLKIIGQKIEGGQSKETYSIQSPEVQCVQSAAEAGKYECAYAFDDKFPRDDSEFICAAEYVSGGNTVAVKSKAIKLFERNIKDSSKYPDKKQVFLISDEQWQPILQAVPATIWEKTNEEWCNEIYAPDQQINTRKCAYPLLIYHKEGQNFDADSIYWFIKQYGAGSVTSIKNYETETKVLDNINLPEKRRVSKLWWQQQWKEKGFVVVAGYDNYKEGLLAAQLAAYFNAPLVFVGTQNEMEWRKFLKNKVLIIVGDVNSNILAEIRSSNIVLSYDDNNKKLKYDKNVPVEKTFDVEGLQKFIVYLTNSDKMILVNPNDIKIEYCEPYSYRTKLSSNSISHPFCKDSLASPVLAIAKDEIIVFSETRHSAGISNVGGLMPDSGTPEPGEKVINDIANEVKEKVSSIFSGLFVPKYFTVLASPMAIPFSKMKESAFDPHVAKHFRSSLDRFYVDVDKDNKPDIPFGRIFTRSLSGTSSYIARDVFGVRSKQNNALVLFPNQVSGLFGYQITDFPTGYYSSLTDNTKNIGFSTLCYGDKEVINDHSIPNCNEGELNLPKPEKYKNNKFILYDDHGQPDRWSASILSKDLPLLDSSVMIGMACSTNDYYSISLISLTELFSTTSIENGAIGYFGAVGSATWVDHFHLSEFMKIDEAMMRLFFKYNYDFGTVIKEILSNSVFESSDYTLLGDPTIKINLPELSTPYIKPDSLLNFNVNIFYDIPNTFSYFVKNLENDVSKIGTSSVKVKGPDEIMTIIPECVPEGNYKKCTFTFTPRQSEKDYFFTITTADSTSYYMDRIFFTARSIKPFRIQIFTFKESNPKRTKISILIFNKDGVNKIDPSSIKLVISTESSSREIPNEDLKNNIYNFGKFISVEYTFYPPPPQEYLTHTLKVEVKDNKGNTITASEKIW